MLTANSLKSNYIRLTAAQRQQQFDHFLSFKSHRAFKKIEGPITDYYSFQNEIGNGSFATVKLGKHKKTKMPCAIKIIKKSTVEQDITFMKLNKNEFSILEETIHPHITRVFELLSDKRSYYIVMELVSGGNLL